MRICAFSAWPAPTIVFFTRFGAYSATDTPAFAGTSSAMPRAWPELQGRDRVAIDEGRLHGRLVGAELLDDARKPVMDRDQPLGERKLVVGLDRAAGHDRSAGCPRRRSRPSRCGGGPDRCRECESPGPSWPVDSTSRGACPEAPLPPGFPRDRSSRPAGPLGRARRPPLHRRRRDRGAVRLCARVFRLRLGARLHSADRGRVRAAHRGSDAAADRPRRQRPVHDPRTSAAATGARSRRSPRRPRSRCRSAPWRWS